MNMYLLIFVNGSVLLQQVMELEVDFHILLLKCSAVCKVTLNSICNLDF